jgi:hypothetical protein
MMCFDDHQTVRFGFSTGGVGGIRLPEDEESRRKTPTPLGPNRMANIEACILKLRLMGYTARVPGTPPGELGHVYDILGTCLVVRCQGFTVDFNEFMGITIKSVLPGDALGLLDYYQSKSPPRFSITYPFENQSFFFSLEDDTFVECVIRHVQEATEVVSALPGRLRPG